MSPAKFDRPLVATVLATVLATQVACIPTLAFGPSSVVAQDCRGKFTAQAEARREGVRKVDVVFEVLPGASNLTELELQPTRATLKGKSAAVPVTLRARLENACEDGGVAVLGSFPPTGTSGYLGATAVVGAPKAGGVADPQTGAFSYPLTLQCCGEKSAGRYVVGPGASENLVELGVEPAMILCEADEEHTVTVRGTTAKPGEGGQVRLTVTREDGGTACTLSDTVQPGDATRPAPEVADG